jgi:stage II sporulation protein D
MVLSSIALVSFLSVSALAPATLSTGDALAAELTGGRLLFADDGAPLVAVGLMKGQSKVTLKSTTKWQLDVGAGPVDLPPGSVVVTLQDHEAALLSSYLIIETLEQKLRSQRKERVQQWQARGVPVRALSVGGTYGVKGTVVDTRAELIVVPDGTQLPADVRPVPVKMTTTPSHMSISVRMGQREWKGSSLLLRGKVGDVIEVENVEHSVGYKEHGFENRKFVGDIALVPDDEGRIAVVNIVDERSVVAGVLPAEMFHRAPAEALKAQAVTARGELYSKMGRRHFTDPFHVCSEQHCQVYKGHGAATPSTNAAASATMGELAFVGDALIESVYSAACGGHTEPADVVWDRPPHPALRGVTDGPGAIVLDLSSDGAVRAFLDAARAGSYCGTSSFNQKGDVWRWQRRFDQAQLQAAFADLDVGTVTALRIEERGPGGRLRSLSVVGSKQSTRVLRELPVRKRLGNLRSGLFVIDEERDPSGALVAVVLRGAGFGHGSGMCQQGAIGMAEAGMSYRDIIGHYYGGAVVKRVF